MSDRAKVFRNGGSQAVRLPKKFRFRDEEVNVRQVGNQVILEPADKWPADFLECLGAWRDDVPRPRTRKISSKPNPFDTR